MSSGRITTWFPDEARPADEPSEDGKTLLHQDGVGEARLRDARHTAGTLLVEQSVHVRVVQEILG
ncbi:MAG: hypothetical protein IRY84_15280, partial [Thermobispora bispora]|nr:hypothetical protein [Thermobispora bispora]